MLELEKSQYQNPIFQINYTRYEKKRYNTKLFTTKRATNFN